MRSTGSTRKTGNRVLGLFVLAATLCWTANAQDARAVLEEAARAIGADDLTSIRYVGSGFSFALGQNYTPQDAWPRFRLERYDRLIDYEREASREELVRTQAESPPRGGGNQPIVGVEQQVFCVSGPYAWNQTETLAALPDKASGLAPLPSDAPANATAAPAEAANRRLAIWL
ncbi:MAG TPA: hypothetical protein VIC04_09785, partial [Terriglobia bacterium]